MTPEQNPTFTYSGAEAPILVQKRNYTLLKVELFKKYSIKVLRLGIYICEFIYDLV